MGATTTAVYSRERTDPYCLGADPADLLLRGAPWRRLVVVGDSVAEGVTEPVDGYGPDCWADRVAAALRRRQPELEYLNLGRRGLRTRQVREMQLVPAVAFQPDLAIIVSGGNDLLVEHFDVARVEKQLNSIACVLAAAADVVTLTMYDITRALEMPPQYGSDLGRRLSELRGAIRRVSERHETLLVDFHEHPVCSERDIYTSDFQHANARGHAIAAAEIIRALGRRLGNL